MSMGPERSTMFTSEKKLNLDFHFHFTVLLNKSHLFTSSHFQTAENLFYGGMYTDMQMHNLELGQAGNVFFCVCDVISSLMQCQLEVSRHKVRLSTPPQRD